MTTNHDKLADECHGYDLEGYPVELSIFDVPPRIATKLARCNEIAVAQRFKSAHEGASVASAEDRAIMERRYVDPWPFKYVYSLNA